MNLSWLKTTSGLGFIDLFDILGSDNALSREFYETSFVISILEYTKEFKGKFTRLVFVPFCMYFLSVLITFSLIMDEDFEIDASQPIN